MMMERKVRENEALDPLQKTLLIEAGDLEVADLLGDLQTQEVEAVMEVTLAQVKMKAKLTLDRINAEICKDKEIILTQNGPSTLVIKPNITQKPQVRI